MRELIPNAVMKCSSKCHARGEWDPALLRAGSLGDTWRVSRDWGTETYWKKEPYTFTN